MIQPKVVQDQERLKQYRKEVAEKKKQKKKKKYKPKPKPKVDHSKEYEDPKWKKKRKEILARDKYTCVRCRIKATLFHIHHLLYIKGKRIWEVPDYYLVTLCEDCHKEEHSQQYVPPSKHY